ncbi:MAG: chromosome segregation protein SMC [Gammaproteobacteria bacterium]|nr:chromosome segregation protein SMC [Gammaproteobacteria bacterium]
MRLSSIKLSGFKSFVEPTTILFPSNLLGVVGPNGCGKSNIIDAVKWVLGESSAKTLRGESMADVIFNGSSNRKPVGRASVDLVFDNSDAAISGAYASFSEISVRRVVTRDGSSQYFLNNTRCRRKDVTNILLGTGLGSQGYSIIEQGTISRLVEAKPEELRSFLEEAAGISKYKSRRQETENKIKNTKDNIDRLTDLTDEVDKQLNHLDKQAKNAEKYKELKEDQRKLKAEHLVLRIKQLKKEYDSMSNIVGKKQNDLESIISKRTSTESTIERLRLSQSSSNDQFNEIQAKYYKAGAEIARLEQSIKHRKEVSSRQKDDLDLINSEIKEISSHISSDESEIAKLDQILDGTDKELNDAISVLESSLINLKESEGRIQTYVEELDKLITNFTSKETKFSEKIEILRSKLHEQSSHLSSLEAIQGAKLSGVNKEVNTWLDSRKIDSSDTLINKIKVVNGWGKAVETVLGKHLGAICVDSITDFYKDCSSLPKGSIDLLECKPEANRNSDKKKLSSYISGVDLSYFLEDIYVAENLQSAIKLLSNLNDNESVVTKEGYWVSEKWMKIAYSDSNDTGVIVRSEDIKSVKVKINGINKEILSVETSFSEERDSYQKEQEELKLDRARAEKNLSDIRDIVEQNKDIVSKLTIKLESQKSSKESVSASLDRVYTQKNNLSDRYNLLQEKIKEEVDPLSDEQNTLPSKVKERNLIEKNLSSLRNELDSINKELSNSELARAKEEREAAREKELLDEEKFKLKELQVRSQTLLERLSETGNNFDILVSNLPEHSSLETWQSMIDKNEAKISRLGAINLAAIDEFANQSERKDYLDSQMKDLLEALDTLEKAIRKIDSETRSKFKQTFDETNVGLSNLFPRLFGGGSAYLELEGDDLLKSGVVVMAKPPGKRISSIQLLSGGEKALTAVALVFSIFQLNPAPFCMLDEVDAPLDEVNVGRFSDIVKEMSNKVQFILITHNKTTMESMSQLTGITMSEPGISRLVSVDIEEAMKIVNT